MSNGKKIFYEVLTKVKCIVANGHGRHQTCIATSYDALHIVHTLPVINYRPSTDGCAIQTMLLPIYNRRLTGSNKRGPTTLLLFTMYS